MNRYCVFGLAALARLVAQVLHFYSNWLLEAVMSGKDRGLDVLRNLQDFMAWLVRVFADRLGTRPDRDRDLDEDAWEGRWQSGLFAR